MSSQEAFARAAAAFGGDGDDMDNGGGSFVAKPKSKDANNAAPKPFPNPFQQNNHMDASGSFVMVKSKAEASTTASAAAPKPFPNPFQQNNFTDDSGSFVVAAKPANASNMSPFAGANNPFAGAGGGDDSGSFVVAGGGANNQARKHHGRPPTSIEEAAASLAASMGMEDDDPLKRAAAAFDTEATNSNNRKDGTAAAAIAAEEAELNSPSSDEDEQDPDPLFNQVELPRPVFFGTGVPNVIQHEYESWAHPYPSHGGANKTQGAGTLHSSWTSVPPVDATSSSGSSSDSDDDDEEGEGEGESTISNNTMTRQQLHHQHQQQLAAARSTNPLPRFLQDAQTMRTDHPGLKNLQSALIVYSKMQQFTTYVPQWTNSWDKLYKKQRYWNRVVSAKAATNVPSSDGNDTNDPSKRASGHDCAAVLIPVSKLDIAVHTPLYSCDDASLPTEADLGQFDTNEQKLKAQHEREIQMQLERVFPEVFRTNVIQSPSPCRDVNDSTSWNNRDYVNPFTPGMAAAAAANGGNYFGGVAGSTIGGGDAGPSAAARSSADASPLIGGGVAGSGNPNSSNINKDSSFSTAGGGRSVSGDTAASQKGGNAAARAAAADGAAAVAGANVGGGGGAAAAQQQQQSNMNTTSPASVKSLATGTQQQRAAAALEARKKNARVGWWNKDEPAAPVPGTPKDATTPTALAGGEEKKAAATLTVATKDSGPLPLLIKDASAAVDPNLKGGSSVMGGGAILPSLLNYNLRTPLPPSILQLRQHNLPLSLVNQTSTLASTLPFMCDRPPSWRYLQIDTQAVGFASPVMVGTSTAGGGGAGAGGAGSGSSGDKSGGGAAAASGAAGGNSAGGEIEPLFCSMAIYHVESVISLVQNLDDAQSIDSASPASADGTQASNSGASAGGRNNNPNVVQRGRLVWNKCGRVTEALRFDVVNDPLIQEKCKKSVWPYNAVSIDPLTGEEKPYDANHEGIQSDGAATSQVSVFCACSFLRCILWTR
jgi:hypothetical protein